MSDKELIKQTELSFDELLDRAVQLRGRPVDVEKWAQQLAADVADLVD